MRDRETIDSELRRIALSRQSIDERGSQPWSEGWTNCSTSGWATPRHPRPTWADPRRVKRVADVGRNHARHAFNA